MAPELIYCGDGNKRFAQIAIESGMLYGAQLPPRSLHYPIHMADQNWKAPDRPNYMAALAKYRPFMATVIDLERLEQLPTVLDWAEEAAQWVSVVMIIPKIFGIIPAIPERINGADVRLGFSVPTAYGGTEVPAWEFSGRPVHLLGGTPHKQIELSHYMDVVSIDGNYSKLMASKFGQFWQPGTATWAKDRHWPKLSEAGCFAHFDIPYIAFRRSCEAIVKFWRQP